MNNVCRLLQAVTRSFEVTDCYLTQPLMDLRDLVTVVDTTDLPSNEFTAQQNQID
jgi:hypothetical protein